MKRSGRSFICAEFGQSTEVATALMQKIVDQLDTLYKDEEMIGYFATILHNETSIEEEMLSEHEIMAVSDGKFPIVFINVTYDTDIGYSSKLKKLETDFNLILLKAFSG